MEAASNRYDTPVPIGHVHERMVPLHELGTVLNGPGERTVQLVIRGPAHDRVARLGRMPSVPRTQFVPCEKHEIRVRGYYAIGRVSFITGNTQLRTLLDEPKTLDIVVDAVRRRKDPQTGVAPTQARFVGPLETCLMRREGRWTEIAPRGHGPAVVGVDVQDGMAYAIRLRGEDKPIELVRGKPVETGVIEWQSITMGHAGRRIVDASRFVRDKGGHQLSLVLLEGDEVRLFTLERNGKTHWSEPSKLPGTPIEADGTGSAKRVEHMPIATSILTQAWAEDGYLVTRYPLQLINGLPLWAYLQASG
jgi:hypothetical protein